MKKVKKFLKAMTCIASAALIALGSTATVGATVQMADYMDESQRDVMSMYQFMPEDCPHEGGFAWVTVTSPTETTNGLAEETCSACGTVNQTKEIPYLKFNGASLTLTDNMTIQYKVSKALLTQGGYTDPYVRFVMDGATTVVTDYTVDGDMYVFPFENIAPHLMGQNIEATLYATLDGKLYQSARRDYSVATYCYNSLSKYTADSFSELRTLLVDLLNYGAATQTYLGYATDALVNAQLTDTQKAWGTASDRELTSVLDREYVVRDTATVAWKGAGLTLQESVALRLKINATDVSGLSAKVISTNGIHIIPAEKFVETDGGHYIFFDWLTAAQMSEAIYITIYEGDTAVSNTLCYSVESYAYSKQSDSNTDLVALVRAMMRYGDAAKAYVNRNVEQPEVPEGGWGDNDKEGWTKPY